MQRQTTRVFFFRFVTIKICYWLWLFAVFETSVCMSTCEQQVAVLRQSAEFPQQDWAPLLSRCPKTHDCVTAVPRIRHIFLCYFHINSAAPSCLSVLSRSNLKTSLHFQTRCCGLRVKAPLFFSHFCGNEKVPQILPHFSRLPPLLVSVMVQLRLRIWKWNLEGRAHTKPATQLHTGANMQSDQHLRHV